MEQKQSVGQVMITEEEIRRRAKEIGAQITRDYQGEEIVLVGILRGAIVWLADIMKCIDLDVIIDFMALSSYGASTKSSGIVKIEKDLSSNIEGKHVIIVEDIVDSGTTLEYLKHYFENRNTKSVKICALLDKHGGRKAPIQVEYKGFDVEDKFIIGYGLDFNQKYRNLPYISFLEN